MNGVNIYEAGLRSQRDGITSAYRGYFQLVTSLEGTHYDVISVRINVQVE